MQYNVWGKKREGEKAYIIIVEIPLNFKRNILLFLVNIFIDVSLLFNKHLNGIKFKDSSLILLMQNSIGPISHWVRQSTILLVKFTNQLPIVVSLVYYELIHPQ
jgi:hypothetical protein